MRFSFLYLILFSALVFLPGDLSAQCAMCKQAVESSMKGNNGSIARGLNSGILYLMAVPYLAIMFIFRKQLGELFKKLRARIFKTSAEA